MPHWTVHLDGGPRRVNHAAALVGNWIYMFGGYCTGGDYHSLIPIDVYALDTVLLRWRKLPIASGEETSQKLVPYLRYGHSVVNYEGKVYLWGGRNDNYGACNKVFCYDTKTLKWSRPRTEGERPGGRDGHTACLIGDNMYIFGGFEDGMVQCYANTVYSLDLKEMFWTYIKAKGDIPHWRDFHTAAAYHHRMIVFGGRSDESGPYYTNREFYCNRLQVLDTQTKVWSAPPTTGDIPIGRRSHSAFMYRDHMYIFGGYNDITKMHYNDLYRLDLCNYEWSKVMTSGQTPRNRRRQCCIVVQDHVIMFGGTSPKDTPIPGGSDDENLMDLADLHILDFAPSLKTLCKVAVIRYQLDISCLPLDIRWELEAMTTDNSISQPLEMPQG
ncbi:kelch domain-containing protein 3-like [Acanthaster planci]|uniref:Kelch domain-containing protein 3-like n=1 Tax=Acanthaster planci TaxID=133434 RepID=A0A8B7YTP5_ACAPL|nr:kelch domain-containing protein 3-like [Acanthaster planci]XP_022094721.1 kelch domain-containing protein 3-like [Acanthaster planci]XP_022094722.1 kelch domain-containing protein 3-like [Acanthaster planci]